ncbi:MAG: hypothetical protein HW386_2501 [Gammaproteobacteria bacterium]|nr:hypothetical protein [Gammaproteobacteria bacterium]
MARVQGCTGATAALHPGCDFLVYKIRSVPGLNEIPPPACAGGGITEHVTY